MTTTATSLAGSRNRLPQPYWVHILRQLRSIPGLFAFAELWPARQALPLLCRSAAGLGRVHALLLACLHRAIHRTSPYYADGTAHYGGDRLIWLYDILALVKRLKTPEARVRSSMG